MTAVRLTACSPVEHISFPVFEPEGEDASHALEANREVYWGSGFEETGIYDRGLLKCGNVVTGPAIIEQDDTTCVIPEGRKLTIDKYLNGVIEHV